jgi:Bacterial Ig-like domain (group 2)
MDTTNALARVDARTRRLAFLLALAVAGCHSSSTSRAPQSLAVSPGPAYLAVGDSRRLTATARYADGSAPLQTGVKWTSSDPMVATVDQTGLVQALGKGTATITASHAASGISGAADVTARSVTALSFAAAGLAQAATVDTAQAYFHITGLTPGGIYSVDIGDLGDDLDLAVYGDASLSPSSQLCVSQQVGTTLEACDAAASASGDLYVAVDGQWTEQGSDFVLHATNAVPVTPKAVLAFPGALPLTGTAGRAEIAYEVTGLTPGAAYVVRISGLTDDEDLDVYSDAYEYASACGSYNSGTADDVCTATANAGGTLLVALDGESTTNGSNFHLDIAPAR